MPKAAVNEEGDPVLRKHQVGIPRQVLSMEPEPESHSVREATHAHFRRCVLARDTGHQPRSALRRNVVNQGYSAAMLTEEALCIAFATMVRMSLAIMGETLFPIIRKLCQIVGWKRWLSGNP